MGKIVKKSKNESRLEKICTGLLSYQQDESKDRGRETVALIHAGLTLDRISHIRSNLSSPDSNLSNLSRARERSRRRREMRDITPKGLYSNRTTESRKAISLLALLHSSIHRDPKDRDNTMHAHEGTVPDEGVSQVLESLRKSRVSISKLEAPVTNYFSHITWQDLLEIEKFIGERGVARINRWEASNTNGDKALVKADLNRVRRLFFWIIDLTESLWGVPGIGADDRTMFQVFQRRDVFLPLLKLDSMMKIMGIRTPDEVKFYLTALFTRYAHIDVFKHDLRMVPFKVFGSPKNLWIYLRFLKYDWYQLADVFDSKKFEARKKKVASASSNERMVSMSLSICRDLINKRSESDDSRLYLEIPEAIGEAPPFVHYCWGSPFVRRMRKAGFLKHVWPDFSESLSAVSSAAKEDRSYLEALRTIQEESDRMWAKSGIPKTTKSDFKMIHSLLSDFCDASYSEVRECLSL